MLQNTVSNFTHKLLDEVEGTDEPVEGDQASTSKQVEPGCDRNADISQNQTSSTKARPYWRRITI